MDDPPHHGYSEDEEESKSINSSESDSIASIESIKMRPFDAKLRRRSKRQSKFAHLGETASISSCSCYQLVNNEQKSDSQLTRQR